MASRALTTWGTDSAEKLDELIAAHARVEGTARGRRYATAQINASLVVQLAAHFQLFCRDLHTDAADVLVSAAPMAYRSMLKIAFTKRRGLDRGNAFPQKIGEDFQRFDLDLWTQAEESSSLATKRRTMLEQVMTWRNAIAHQDFHFSSQQEALLARTAPTLAWARRWRSACDGLAVTLERVVGEHAQAVTGVRPW